MLRQFFSSIYLLFAASHALAQPVDLDRSFGSSGSGFATFGIDVSGSTLTDRGVAVFPEIGGGYWALGQAASATPNFVRASFVKVNSAGIATANVLDTNNVLSIEAACTQPDGKMIVFMRDTNSTGNSIRIRRYLSDGSLDSSFANATGSMSYGSGLFEFVNGVSCGDTDFVAVVGLSATEFGLRGQRVLRANYTASQLSFGGLNVPSSGVDEARAVVRLGSGQVVSVSDFDNDTVGPSVRFRVYANSVTSSGTTSDYELSTANCDLNSPGVTTTIGAIETDGGNNIWVTGNASGIQINRVWVLNATVQVDGSVSAISCGSVNFVGVGNDIRAKPKRISRNSGKLYVYGDGPGLSGVGGMGQFLLRFVGAANSVPVADTAFGQIRFNYPRANPGSTPSDRAADGFFDTRFLPARLLLLGASSFNQADEDITLTRMVLAPMFANGFE